MSTIKELIQTGEITEHHWLAKANVRGEDVVIIDGLVRWNYGTWCKGTWKGGFWENGAWKGGVWENGTWYKGTWKGGTWKDGIWEDGDWCDGIWEDGIWYNGIWEDGKWCRGKWNGGNWEGGTWEDGFKLIEGYSKWAMFYSINEIEIGCKVKTTAEWDEWFDSDEVYETDRDTEEFELIYQDFLRVKELQKLRNETL